MTHYKILYKPVDRAGRSADPSLAASLRFEVHFLLLVAHRKEARLTIK